MEIYIGWAKDWFTEPALTKEQKEKTYPQRSLKSLQVFYIIGNQPLASRNKDSITMQDFNYSGKLSRLNNDKGLMLSSE